MSRKRRRVERLRPNEECAAFVDAGASICGFRLVPGSVCSPLVLHCSPPAEVFLMKRNWAKCWSPWAPGNSALQVGTLTVTCTACNKEMPVNRPACPHSKQVQLP